MDLIKIFTKSIGLAFFLFLILFIPILFRLFFEWIKYIISPFYKNEKISFFKVFFKKGKLLEIQFYNYIYKLGVKKIILNVVIPGKNKENEIDCIFEYNNSTFVVEIKAYTGLITGKYNDREWTSYFGKNKYKFMNPLHQNYGHTMAISTLLNIEHDKLVSFVYFSPHAKLKMNIKNVLQYPQLQNFLDRDHPKTTGIVSQLEPYKNLEKQKTR